MNGRFEKKVAAREVAVPLSALEALRLSGKRTHAIGSDVTSRSADASDGRDNPVADASARTVPLRAEGTEECRGC